MNSLLHNIRFYILLMSVGLSLIFYLWFMVVASEKNISNLINSYALTAVSFLYMALLAGPLTKIFPQLPFRSRYMKARRAIGVSAFYFGLLHVGFVIFGVFGSIQALLALPIRYLFPFLLGLGALLILLLMAVTSFDKVITKMTFPRWKRLHQFVYLAGFLVLIHATMVGSHFKELFSPIPVILYTATTLLVVLHLYGLYRKHKRSQINTKSLA